MIQLASAVIKIPQKSDVVTFSAFQKMSKKPKQTEFVMVLSKVEPFTIISKKHNVYFLHLKNTFMARA